MLSELRCLSANLWNGRGFPQTALARRTNREQRVGWSAMSIQQRAVFPHIYAHEQRIRPGKAL